MTGVCFPVHTFCRLQCLDLRQGYDRCRLLGFSMMEREMRLFDALRVISAKIKNRMVMYRRLSHFQCGDCEAAERCGRLPSDDCIERIVQIERDGDQPRSRSLRDYQATY